MTAMEDGVLEAARAIRPYLRQLAGPAAQELDRQIADLLTETAEGNRAGRLRRLLDSNDSTGGFLVAVLHDAPEFRPPYLQPEYQLRTSADTAPPGDAAPVLHSGRFTCPNGDYTWYRPDVGTSVPECPTHHIPLTRS
ncbi:hypothetical protein [Streptomyces sp. WMMB 322]|uniref:hypothetical protein n=1 Tax=Streptomyces sp. WMMB 322 TaxID=1286821 RepID=UPI0015860B2E|nr:hypothetical protein [Streptomyces sp. WMMB 322]